MMPMLEREQDLHALLMAAEAVADGRGQVVQIAGGAGIGKSRLIAEFTARLPAGMIAATGNCQMFDAPRPLGALFDMGTLGETFRGDINSAVLDADPFAKVARAIQDLRAPSVLIFEDARYADSATLDVLRFLCQRIAALTVMIVISYRCDEVSPVHPLTAVLGSSPSRFTSRVTLAPLSEDATVQLAGLIGAASDGVFQQTGGNPFLVLECLRERSGQCEAIPQAIIQSSMARLALVEPDTRNWIRLLAFHPTHVDAQLLDRLSETFSYPRCILPGWNGFLIEGADGNIGFIHEIVRQAIQSVVPAAQRQQMHEAWLEVLCADEAFAQAHSELVLHHAMEARLNELAVQYARIASCQAEARGDYIEAARLLKIALPHARLIGPEAYAELFEIWICRSSVSEDASDEMLAEVVRNNVQWKRLNQPVQLARNHLLLCRLHRYRAERQMARNHLTIAISLLEDAQDSQGDLALAFSLHAQMDLEERRNEEAFSTARAAVKRARQTGDRNSRIDGLVTMVVAGSRLRKTSNHALLSALRNSAEHSSLHEMTARINAILCDEALADMDLPTAERVIAGWAQSKNIAPHCWKAALDCREALALVLHGKLEEGRACASRQLENGRIVRSMQFPARLALALSLSRCQDPGADDALAQARIIAQASGDPRNVALVGLALIEHAFLEGRIEDALYLCDMDDVGCVGSEMTDTDRLLQIWRARLEWVADKDSAPFPKPDSPEWVSELTALGYCFKAALAKLFIDGPDAPKLLGEAVADFTQEGAKAGLNCAYRVARARGIVLAGTRRERGPYRAARSHRLGLTRREVEILRMMVEGAGNREIAEHFGRSLRTVEHHVSAILGKMGLDSRIQAVLFAIAHRDILELTDQVH